MLHCQYKFIKTDAQSVSRLVLRTSTRSNQGCADRKLDCLSSWRAAESILGLLMTLTGNPESGTPADQDSGAADCGWLKQPIHHPGVMMRQVQIGNDV